ncbi:toll/interleukin-1 receptor-like protein [Rosa chinensis]|uniref:toll/interleukin-1 receptor-like protein n=1 Tax=Rosa chinensis TaxID=74649 RepID=UPI001AD8D016|nr:toll/interleukin-1 receptor-like protein [Rosa chinensis]
MAFTSTPPRTYDVFLSLRGIDTREGFTERLYQKLRWHKFDVFKDDEEPQKGIPISEKLLTAIEESKTAIIVMSPNFASSTWCLDELLKILECMEARNTVLPVFYDVDPSHVRHQLGTFAEAMVKHEQRIKVDKVQLWRDALTKLANFVGWTSKDYGSEAEVIDEIVEQVQNKVHPAITLLGSTEKLVGMDSELKKFIRLLEPEADDVCFLGIWGMVGIGKTTLARLVYERVSHNFQVSCFLANVKEVSEKQSLVHLQNQLLS